MDNSLVDSQIRANKIKEGVLDKRSKFLKEWRDRWVVLTQNYLFTFKSKVYVDPTDVIDIRTIKSIKSYLKHYEDRETCAFKLSSDETELYFRCKGATEKWSWMVAIERLMDYRNNGRSAYNDIDAIKSKGFDAVSASTSSSSPMKPPTSEGGLANLIQKEVQKEVTKEVNKEIRKELHTGGGLSIGSIVKDVERDVKKDVVKEVEKDLRKIDEVRKVEDTIKQAEREVHNLEREAKHIEREVKQIDREAEKLVQKVQKIADKPVVLVKEAEKVIQKVVAPTVTTSQTSPVKPAVAPVVTATSPASQASTTIPTKTEGGSDGPTIEKEGKNFSQLKKLYERKIEEVQLSKASSRTDNPVIAATKSTELPLEAVLHQRRGAVAAGLFGEFESKNIEGFQIILEFIVDMAANKNTGYANYLIYETKNNKMRKAFSELFVEVYTEETNEKQAQAMLSFLLVAYYESGNLFDANQVRRLRKTVLRYISIFKKEETLILSMKAFVMLHGADPYDKETVRTVLKDLQQAENSKNDELRGLARKIREQANL